MIGLLLWITVIVFVMAVIWLFVKYGIADEPTDTLPTSLDAPISTEPHIHNYEYSGEDSYDIDTGTWFHIDKCTDCPARRYV